MIDIRARVTKLSGASDATCLTCNARTGNWMAELQDLLEDLKIPVEDFCAVPFPYCGKPFEVKRGRLRLIDGSQCINRGHLVEMLRSIMKRGVKV